MKLPINRNKLTAVIGVATIIFSSSCKKLIEINGPITSVNSANVYDNDATSISVLNGIYTNMSGNSVFAGTQSISLRAGLSADELTLSTQASDPNLPLYYRNALNVNSTAGSEFWGAIYKFVFQSNSAIEGLESSNSLTPAVKNQLLGEAKFFRAFSYFYLVNLFGDLPLVITTDYSQNAQSGRSSSEIIYNQIIIDLKDAQGLLSENYLDATLLSITAERVRPTKWAATALLARVYLYLGDWADAESQATSVIINNNTLFSLSAPDKAFLKASLGNKEAIWQLQPINTGYNTEDAKVFIINGAQGNSRPVYLSQTLLSSFDASDLRKTTWIKDTTINGTKYPYPYKYKLATLNAPVNEYLMVLRLGEQFLIRAEARAMQGKFQQAIDDVNAVRLKHGGFTIPLTAPSTQDAAMNAILQERRIELFSEWGHRWFDLKRTKAIDAVMATATPQKGGGGWQSFQQLYPIPVSDIQLDLNLSPNPGY